MAEVMVVEVVPWWEEAVVDLPSVRWYQMKVEEVADWRSLEASLRENQRIDEVSGEVKGGGVDLAVINSLLGEIPKDVMGERGRDIIEVEFGVKMWYLKFKILVQAAILVN
ncbi:hypothetical protein Tco_0609601 [Tanacetum coccineum]